MLVMARDLRYVGGLVYGGTRRVGVCAKFYGACICIYASRECNLMCNSHLFLGFRS